MLLGERRKDPADLSAAVEAHERALEALSPGVSPMSWAFAEDNLGRALADQGELGSSTQPLDEAATAFQNALKVRTRETQPEQWASTMQHLRRVEADLAR